MKIKLRTTYAGPAGCYSPGQVADVPEADARALVAGGFAEAVEAPRVETRVVAAPEAAVSARGRKPRG